MKRRDETCMGCGTPLDWQADGMSPEPIRLRDGDVCGLDCIATERECRWEADERAQWGLWD